MLLTLALAPGIAIILFIYNRDSYDREPLKALAISFLLGVACTIPAVLLQLSGTSALKMVVAENTVLWFSILAFLIVGLSEEFCKFLMVKWYAYPKPFFNEPFDGIVYAVMVSMGFATLENIGYVYQHGIETAFMRMFLSVPAHGAFAAIMGYHIGLAKFKPFHAKNHLIKAVLIPALLHGAYDFFLMLQLNKKVTEQVSNGLLFAAALVAFIIAIRLSLKSIKIHRALSKMHFEKLQNVDAGS